jgi:iron complex outermembrane receptor protein
LTWGAAAEGAASSGAALASRAELPGGQTAGDIRTNTDHRLASGYLRVGWAPDPATRVGLSLLLADGEKGVAPEGHLDPTVEQVRYWRYPHWRYGLVSLQGEHRAGAYGLRGAAWVTRFAQSIEQFADIAYDSLDAVQHDTDAALGTRVVLERTLSAGAVRVAVHGTHAWHSAREAEGDALAGESRQFRHTLASAALEGEMRPVTAVTLSAGASADVFAPHETGGQPMPAALRSLGLSGGAALRTGPGFAVRASAGRRTRFPTMREWFDGALGRFVANPDLRPETIWSAEAGIERTSAGGAIEVVAFGRVVDGTIDQETLPDGRRQRLNLGGSRVVGVESRGDLRLPASFRVEGHVTLMHVRGHTDDEPSRLLAETPGLIGYFALARAPDTGAAASAEVSVVGAAYSRAPAGLVRLPPSVSVNLRAAWRWSPGREVFARLQNAFDAVVLPQAGLPAPGREVRVGVSVALG